MISKDRLKQLTLDLLEQTSAMTLATASGNIAWSAPVYYVYQDSFFYFFSKPDSRHILESMAGGEAAASIHAYADSWQHIRGIQMSGRIMKASLGVKSVRAVRAYLKKFPFTADFFQNDPDINLEDFVKRFKVNFYYFKPEMIYYQDNQIRFGFREVVDL